MPHRILVINPGATSTKLGLFEGDTCVAREILRHSFGESEPLLEQMPRRLEEVRSFLAERLPEGALELDAVVGRGGLLPPLRAGTYRVDEAMLDDLRRARRGEHASNLGGLLAYEVAQVASKQVASKQVASKQDASTEAFIVDPVSVDEMTDVARVSGLAGVERESLCHALNIRAVAHRFARESERELADVRLVVAHLGTGVSLAAVDRGRLVDVVNPLDEGPFGLDRTGGLPNHALVERCFEADASAEQVRRKLLGDGGVFSYLGTRDAREMLEMEDNGDASAALVRRALVYQTSKAVGALATVLEGEVDAVVLTGGMAHSDKIVAGIERRVQWIAPIARYPGEDELSALAEGALRVLRGEEQARSY